jgi:formylglycine-generating enzyme required for sulfatase activity
MCLLYLLFGLRGEHDRDGAFQVRWWPLRELDEPPPAYRRPIGVVQLALAVSTKLRHLPSRVQPILETPSTPERYAEFLDYARRHGESLQRAVVVAGMVQVPGGAFKMGSDHPSVEVDESPARVVTLELFYIDRCEVDCKAYGDFLADLDANCSQLPRYPAPLGWQARRAEREQLPVAGISWLDASLFALWAGKALPTEAEWEKAARAPQSGLWPWGDTFQASHCCFRDTAHGGPVAADGTYPEGQSGLGLLHMAGNVREWCADAPAMPLEPARSLVGHRVVRGGSFASAAIATRATYRDAHREEVGVADLGFRCVVRARSER